MKHNNFRRRLLQIAALWSIASFGVSTGAEDPAQLLEKAVSDYSGGKYEQAAEGFRQLLAANPKDDVAIYFLAASLANSGHAQDSLVQLKQLVASGSCLRPRDKTFSALLEQPEYQTVVRALASAGSAKSQTAFTIPEPDLFPEGIAYDDAGKILFVGSIHKRKIVGININTNKVEPFVESKQGGLMAVLGMKVDSAKQHLWAVSVADPTMMGYSEKDDAGMNAVYQFDIKRKALIRKYELSGKPDHYLNDLVLDPSGRVFVTDSSTGEVFTIAPDGAKLEVFVPAGTFSSLNGIAVSGDGKILYVADTLKGIYSIVLSTRAIERVPTAGSATLGIDGLYWYKNSLIGVFNMIQPGRIMKFDLDDQGQKIVRSTILECGNPLYDDPTTAAIAGDHFFLIANSQLTRFNPDGTPFPIDKLEPVRILKLNLAGSK